MIIIYNIIFFIGIICVILSMIINLRDTGDLKVWIWCVIGMIMASDAVLYKNAISTPSAIDVYRGKTTLEITYKDSIPVDSVVVFKK